MANFVALVALGAFLELLHLDPEAALDPLGPAELMLLLEAIQFGSFLLPGCCKDLTDVVLGELLAVRFSAKNCSTS